MLARECPGGESFGARDPLECRRMAEASSMALERKEPRESAGESTRARLLLVLAAAVAFTAIFLRLGGLALMDPDEGRNSQVASEMEQSGSWLVPTYNDLDYLDKPAFFFKAVALSFAAFGRSEILRVGRRRQKASVGRRT